ncbi:MAG: TetR/AcrR family transcriptional regulator [Lachnospiraceae bacterium]|nr:TetR/AcrR family transcriptional regulator [Lachnospiraceae bacterium]
MNEKFFDLAKEKQDRIMNAAISTFARRGYRYASTDEMKTKAGISKGLLFHYFGDKASLYRYVCEYSSKYMMLEMRQFLGDQTLPYFDMLLVREEAFGDIVKNYPSMPVFLDSIREEDDPEALEISDGSVSEYRRFMDDLKNRSLETLEMGSEEKAIMDRMLDYTLQRLRRESYIRGEQDRDSLKEAAVNCIRYVKKTVIG